VDPDTAAELVRATHRAARAAEQVTAALRWLLHAALAIVPLDLAHLIVRLAGW
jgi:hypothetical protein